MFKKNPNRPPITINLKKVTTGYKVVPNESFNPFSFKRITRAIFRSDLAHANPQAHENSLGGLAPGSALIQSPSHITIPLSAKWFSLDLIDDIEKEAFPEFFFDEDEEGKLFKKSPRLYQFYRNSIINLWRQNSKKYLSPAVCRKNLPGDVSSIIRIHAFLEHWGLINFPSKEHSKGYIGSPSVQYCCLVCESTTGSEYYIAQIELGHFFQICEVCYKSKYYPEFLAEEQFKKILPDKRKKDKKNRMNSQQVKKMLQIMSNENIREKQLWGNLASAFPKYTRQEILMNLLEVPANFKMNSNIFDNNEDFINEEDPPSEEEPTIFQDYENPEQCSIAMAFYLWKKLGNGSDYEKLFSAASKHSKYLGSIQTQKSNEMLRMLIDVQQSKIELKALFVQELQNLVEAEERHFKTVSSNLIAQSLKDIDNDDDA